MKTAKFNSCAGAIHRELCEPRPTPLGVIHRGRTLPELSLPIGASEVYFVSEVHFVSEVSPCGEVRASLTSLGR